MSNYEKLLQHEKEKEKYINNLNDLLYADIEFHQDLQVKRISTGQIGYVERYENSINICFIVPEEDLAEYLITKEDFNDDFIIIQNK